MRSRSHLFVVATGIAGIFLFGLFANTAFQSREATVTTQLAETVSAAATTAPTSHDANHAWGYDDYDGPVTWKVRDLAVR